MIPYLEEALGVAEGTLQTDAGIMLCTILVATAFFAVVKVILGWLSSLFGGK